MNITAITVKIIDTFDNDRNLIEEFTAVGAPKLTYSGADDKYQPIMASEFTFNLMVNDKTDGKYFHLYTGNEKRYLVLVEDQNDNLLFEGYLLPDFYSEPYDNGVIFVELTATDGVGLLKGRYLPNLYFKQETSVIKLIAECLRFTKLDKAICFAPAIESAATNYRWDEIAVNGEVYLDGEIEYVFLAGEKMPKRKNCYEILELLLKSLGCSLFAQGNVWYIEGINRKNESNQSVFNYTFDGVFINTSVVVKEVIDVQFFKTPIVSVLSPWKRIDVSWNIDEDGILVPDWAIKEIPTDALIPNPNPKDVYSFWKSSGALSVDVFSAELIKIQQFIGTGAVVPGNFPFSVIHGNKAPRNLEVKIISSGPGTINTYAQNPATLAANFVNIKKKKYLKITDKYIERTIDIEYKFVSEARFVDNIITNPAILNIKERNIANAYKNEFLIGSNILASSKLNDSDVLLKRPLADKSDNNYNYPDDLQYLDYFDWKPYTATASLKLEDLTFPQNGFFDIKLHAPVSPDYTNPWFYGYVVQQLNVKIAALKSWEDTLVRNIDFATTYDLDIFHGDSIADLSEKQFRFRRSKYVNVPGSSVLISVLLSAINVDVYYYYLDYANYLLVLNNQNSIVVNYGGQQIFLNDLSANSAVWSVGYVAASGIFYIEINTSLITHPSGIGSSVSDFNDLALVVVSGLVLSGYMPEDNEWRESWKRFGVVENIRYGIALAKIYHDVQPEALAVIEGTATSLVFPRELLNFQWRDVKQFIPTRMTIDFTLGRTNLFMIESKNQNITDYVSE